MLFTDNYCISPNDLIALEPSLQQESRDYSRKAPLDIQACVYQAISEGRDVLLARNQAYSNLRAWPNINNISSNHYSGLWGYLPTNSNIARYRPGQIIVSDLQPGYQSPIQMWLSYLALMRFYVKLANAVPESADRFAKKRDLYASSAYQKFSQMQALGVPYVQIPLPAPGAIGEPNSGAFGLNNVTSAVPGTGSPAGGYYWVAITWVDQSNIALYQSPAKRHNAESGPSVRIALQIPPGQVLKVTTDSLNPPTGVVDPSIPMTSFWSATLRATGWNVYVAPSLSNPQDLVTIPPLTTFILQNSTPIPILNTAYTLTGDPATTGFALWPGQWPSANMPIPGPMMFRG